MSRDILDTEIGRVVVDTLPLAALDTECGIRDVAAACTRRGELQVRDEIRPFVEDADGTVVRPRALRLLVRRR